MKKLEKGKGNSFLSHGFCAFTYSEKWFWRRFETIKGNTGSQQLLIDIYFFFKYSSVRREDYKEMENLTDVTAEYLLKYWYCSTRWLYIGKVVWMTEQMQNINEYCLTFLPAQKGFMNKNGVGNTERYQRVKKAMKNGLLLPTSFLFYSSNIFQPFMLLFQSKQPLICILHIRKKKLVGDMLSKFYNIKFLSLLVLWTAQNFWVDQVWCLCKEKVL